MKALEELLKHSSELKHKLKVLASTIHTKILCKRKFHEQACAELETQLILFVRLIEIDNAIQSPETYTDKSFTKLCIERKRVISEVEFYINSQVTWVNSCLKELKK